MGHQRLHTRVQWSIKQSHRSTFKTLLRKDNKSFLKTKTEYLAHRTLTNSHTFPLKLEKYLARSPFIIFVTPEHVKRSKNTKLKLHLMDKKIKSELQNKAKQKTYKQAIPFFLPEKWKIDYQCHC